ncbi:cation transporter, partial [Halorubrum laminariae]
MTDDSDADRGHEGHPDADGTDADTGGRRELTARLAIPEMDCPSCARKVDSSLGRVDGVVNVDLNPTTGTAAVTYDADRTDEAAVVAAIEAAGYEVSGGRRGAAERAGGSDGANADGERDSPGV